MPIPLIPSSTTAAWTGDRFFVYMVTLVAATAGFLFGFDIAVINGALMLMRDQFRLTEIQTELAASSLLAGCIVGATFAGPLSDRYGRRRILMVAALLFAASSLGSALPRNLTEFVIARLLGGFAIGAASLLAPLYIAEVAPPQIRGRLVTMNQFAIGSGVLMAYFTNWLLSFQGPGSWRLMFAVAAIPSLALVAGLFFVPESPRWLVERGLHPAAHAILARVAGAETARAELAAIRESVAEESGTLSELWQPGVRTAVLIAVALAVLQQFSGMNTVLFYGSIIFREQMGHTSDTDAIGLNVVIGLTMLVTTAAALWIIDRVGRRLLLMLSAAGMVIAQVALAAAFLLKPPPGGFIIGVILFCAGSYTLGLAPVTWVVLSEIFPTRIRGRAMSVATVSLWMACTILTFTFLSLVSALTISGAFLIYSAMCALEIILVWRAVPETSGKTLEEIARFWKR